MYKCTSKVYIAVHKAKVKGLMFVEWLRDQAAVAEPRSDIKIGTLTLRMDLTRQKYNIIKIGIVDMRDRVNRDCWIDSLVEWIVSDRLALVTGHFGENWKLVAEIARQANAVHCEPLMQHMNWQDPQSRQWRTLTFPNYFLCFGFYRTITLVASEYEALPSSFNLAEDLWNETTICFPSWPQNDEGSPFVPNLGAIKMKKVDWSKWIDNVFQTVIWLGTSTPGKQSQEKQKKQKRWDEGWGKGWGKDWHKKNRWDWSGSTESW